MLREQVTYDEGLDDIEQASSIGAGATDIQAQLAAAATPLEYQATLETKFASYDNYCTLFHYILNSEGPVDLEVPNVRPRSISTMLKFITNSSRTVLLGVGCNRRIHLPV